MGQLIVQKYGGSSVADAEKIKNVARRVAEYARLGHRMVVVVSAMGKTTDGLLALAGAITPTPDPREMDMLLATGEQVTIGLLAMALQSLGHPACSFTGPAGRPGHRRRRTPARASSASPPSASAPRSTRAASRWWRASRARPRPATSPPSAAAAPTSPASPSPPRSRRTSARSSPTWTASTPPTPTWCPTPASSPACPTTRCSRWPRLGAKVLQARSVEFAKKYGVPVHVRSTFKPDPGTLVTREDHGMEDVVVTGITHDRGQAKLSILRVPDRPGIAARVFGAPGSPEHHRGHDRAEHQPRRLHRHLLHPARGPTARARRRCSASVAREIGAAGRHRRRPRGQGLHRRRGHAQPRRRRRAACSRRCPRRTSTSR